MTASDGVVRAASAPEDLSPVLVWHPLAEQFRKALRLRIPGIPIETHAGVGRLRRPSAADVLLAWTLPPGALDQLPALRWIQVAGAGVDHFLMRDDLRPQVELTRSNGRFGLQVAEYVVGYLLHTLLGIEDYRRNQDRGVWRQLPRPLLSDRCIGIIGLGNIGSAIAERLTPFGVQILGVCRTARPVPHVARVFAKDDWHAMLPLCDALVVAAPLTTETAGMIDAKAIRALPAGAILLNVGRGGLLDEIALLEALRDGHLGAAILDVFQQEPLPADSPLWTEPRAWVTPHIAGPSEVDPIADEFSENYRHFVSDEPLLNRVERERGY